jgi:hypothetical protein
MIRRATLRLAVTLALVALAAAGCERDTSNLEPATAPVDPLVFDDDFGAFSTYEAFLNSKVDALNIDRSEAAVGSASLRVTVPGPDDPSGWFAGGAFTTSLVRDLSSFNALTFYAKASQNATLDVVGLGNDNTGTSRFEASWSGIPLTTDWAKFAIPIPLPEKLTLERGLFYFAEGHENNMGYDFWFDEVKFENISTISNPRPELATQSLNTFIGATLSLSGTSTTFDVGGTDQTIAHMPGYFTFASSDESVATVEDEVIRIVGSGTAVITAMLGAVNAAGEVTVNVTAAPTEPAPTPPAFGEEDVISLFSNSFTDVTVDSWSAEWDIADVTDFSIDGDDVKAYTNVVFAGIEFASETIDAEEMTHFHMDIWIPEGTVFKVKLVDFGEDGVFGGAQDFEHELAFTGLATSTWVGLEVPLEDFVRLESRGHLAQLIISGVSTAYVDNIYFHK